MSWSSITPVVLAGTMTALVGGEAWDLAKVMVRRLVARSERRRPLGGVSAQRIADLAAILAGRKRPGLREEWRAHLAGEAGDELPSRQKVAAALGFVASAARCRLRDAADLAWIPADAILKSRLLSNLVVWTPTVTAAVILFRHVGTYGVIASAESIAAIGGSLYGLIRVGRWWRGVKPADPKPRTRVSAKQVLSTRVGGQCALCGSTAALEYHHVVPLAIEGSSNLENLQILCANCHRVKDAG